MDKHERARRANALPDRFEDRLDPADLQDIRTMMRGGEWGVGLDVLLAALASTGTPITPDERDELAALAEATGMDGARLEELTIQGVTDNATKD